MLLIHFIPPHPDWASFVLVETPIVATLAAIFSFLFWWDNHHKKPPIPAGTEPSGPMKKGLTCSASVCFFLECMMAVLRLRVGQVRPIHWTVKQDDFTDPHNALERRVEIAGTFNDATGARHRFRASGLTRRSVVETEWSFADFILWRVAASTKDEPWDDIIACQVLIKDHQLQVVNPRP